MSQDKKQITVQDFFRMLDEGYKLVVLENLVLDVGEFMKYHPGGKVYIDSRIGQDVSKYFFGYWKSSEKHLHSNCARQAVNTLIIASLKDQNFEQEMAIAQRISDSDYTVVKLERSDKTQLINIDSSYNPLFQL